MPETVVDEISVMITMMMLSDVEYYIGTRG